MTKMFLINKVLQNYSQLVRDLTNKCILVLQNIKKKIFLSINTDNLKKLAEIKNKFLEIL